MDWPCPPRALAGPVTFCKSASHHCSCSSANQLAFWGYRTGRWHHQTSGPDGHRNAHKESPHVHHRGHDVRKQLVFGWADKSWASQCRCQTLWMHRRAANHTLRMNRVHRCGCSRTSWQMRVRSQLDAGFETGTLTKTFATLRTFL